MDRDDVNRGARLRGNHGIVALLDAEAAHMNWLDRISLNRAARMYARRLPAEMRRCWGASKTYAPGQIKTAIAQLKLPERWAVLGYAAFLGEADFVANASAYPAVLPFDVARACLDRYRRRANSNPYAFETPPNTSDIYTKYGE